MIRAALVPLVLVASGLAGPTTSGQELTAEEVRAWRADLLQLEALILEHHPDPFHRVSEESFHELLAGLVDGAEDLSRARMQCGLIQTVAMLGDVHSGVFFGSLGLRPLPVVFQPFEEGLHLIMGPAERSDLLGARFAGIAGHSADEVLDALSVLFAEESTGGARRGAPQGLRFPELLEGVGLLEPGAPVEYVVETDDGRRHRFAVARSGDPPPMAHLYDQHGLGERLPSSLLPREPYWFERLDSGSFYVQYNQVSDRPGGETLSEFFERMFAELEERPAQRFILDVRNNPGGGSHLSRPLIEGLQGLEDLNRPGALFVLMGRGTGSAAVQLVFALEKSTNALFVGEPSGQGPIFYSDPPTYTLERTGAQVRIARTRWVMSFEGDEREELAPDLSVPFSIADLLAGRDPVLEAAEDFRADRHPRLLERVRSRNRPDAEIQYFGTVPDRRGR